jgi:dethiobiotin synthetase
MTRHTVTASTLVAPSGTNLDAPHRWACFVTGTDTEIGKTLVSSALLVLGQQMGLETLGLKPVAAGTELIEGAQRNEDVEALAACSTQQHALPLRTPYLLGTPAAPHIAAALEGITIDTRVILERVQQLLPTAQAVVVEGVGGFRVPLTDTTDTADLAVSLNLPVILVVGLRLGCINQALLTCEAIQARGLRLAGWVANCGAADMAYRESNVQALQQRIQAPLLGVIPRLDGQDAVARAHQAATYLDAQALSDAFSKLSKFSKS